MKPQLASQVLALGLSVAFMLTGCAQSAASVTTSSESSTASTSRQVTTSDKAGAMTADDILNLEDGVFLVDVRTAEEYAEGHIPGALNASYPKSTGGPCQTEENSASFRNAWAQLNIPEDAHVVVYCRTGVRAAAAASALLEDGYAQVDVYEGSWADWTSDPSHPIEQ